MKFKTSKYTLNDYDLYYKQPQKLACFFHVTGFFCVLISDTVRNWLNPRSLKESKKDIYLNYWHKSPFKSSFHYIYAFNVIIFFKWFAYYRRRCKIKCTSPLSYLTDEQRYFKGPIHEKHIFFKKKYPFRSSSK